MTSLPYPVTCKFLSLSFSFIPGSEKSVWFSKNVCLTSMLLLLFCKSTYNRELLTVSFKKREKTKKSDVVAEVARLNVVGPFAKKF